MATEQDSEDVSRFESPREPYKCANCDADIELATGDCDKCFVATPKQRERRAN